MPSAVHSHPTQPGASAERATPGGLEWFDDVQSAMGGDYIVKGLIDQGTMSVLYGPSNSGKTFFAIDLAFHIAIGAEWRGRRVHQAGVLYLAAEGGRSIINRIVALREAHRGVNVPFAIKRAGLDLLSGQADLDAIVDLAVAVRQRVTCRPLLIVVDTLSRVMAGGDENSAQDMTTLIRNIDAIRARTGAHIMLVHHTGKDTTRGARGHSSLRAATDTEIEVSPPKENGALRMAVVTKQREHAGGEAYAFTLKTITLGHDKDGDTVTTCLVEPADSDEAIAATKAKKGLGVNQKIIAETFDEMVADGLSRPGPDSVGLPAANQFHAVDKAELRRLAMEKIDATDPRNSFNKAMAALTGGRGIFVTGENLVWRIDRRI